LQTSKALERWAVAPVCCVCGALQRPLFAIEGFWYCRCPRCGLTSSDPVPDSQTIEAHYAAKFQSGNYKLSRDYAPQLMTRYKQFVDFAGRLVDFKSAPRVLDVGCFTGDMLCLMQQAGADVYGLELQREAVEIAAEKLPGRIFAADVHSNDFTQLDFDLVTMTGVIEHVTEPVKLLRRCADLLKPGGAIMLETPDSGSLLCRLMGRRWPPYSAVEHIHLFSSRSLRKALEEVGFSNVTTWPHWKPLPISYVYENLENFGPEVRRLIGPAYRLLPGVVTSRTLPFYVGEIMATARIGVGK
jgi:SAM-dependent methyltransferase